MMTPEIKGKKGRKERRLKILTLQTFLLVFWSISKTEIVRWRIACLPKTFVFVLVCFSTKHGIYIRELWPMKYEQVSRNPSKRGMKLFCSSLKSCNVARINFQHCCEKLLFILGIKSWKALHREMNFCRMQGGNCHTTEQSRADCFASKFFFMKETTDKLRTSRNNVFLDKKICETNFPFNGLNGFVWTCISLLNQKN